MSSEQQRILCLRILPARLTIDETATILGFQPHDIPVLISRGLLKPLGHPPPNGQKFFAAVKVEILRNDEAWLARASDAIVKRWSEKNRTRSQRPPSQIGKTGHFVEDSTWNKETPGNLEPENLLR